ncbi:hypothetical protein AYI68_g3058 [Smittium mucronatum]|uniref:AMMECR1 domain-containing protein n=1 Tax=Smittium mucronatum TaxID=133383 RepID=A0A1R0H113_9FUNG|nr:hypothetical protein AYI68_g3058 [Smittium mucronatum]
MAEKAHCVYCFDALMAALEKKSPDTISPKFENRKSPLFVTWNISTNGRETLRGCIGTFSEIHLIPGLSEYAIISAFEDTRFKPIKESELPSLINQ